MGNSQHIFFWVYSGGCIIYHPNRDAFESERGMLLVVTLGQQALNWDCPWQTGTEGSHYS